MKKVLALFIVCGFVTVATAQHISIGPSAGIGDAWMTGIANRDGKISANIGAAFMYSTESHFGIGADARFSINEGVETETQSGNVTQKTKVNANYLRIPVKVAYFFGKWGDRVRPKVYVGPYAGFLLGGDVKQKTTVGTTVVNTEYKSKDYLESFDFGVLAGAGINVRLRPRTWLNIDVNYINGLADVTKANMTPPNATSDWNANRNLGINLGVTFPIGGK